MIFALKSWIGVLLLPLIVLPMSIFQKVIMFVPIILRKSFLLPLLKVVFRPLIRLIHIFGLSSNLFSLRPLTVPEHLLQILLRQWLLIIAITILLQQLPLLDHLAQLFIRILQILKLLLGGLGGRFIVRVVYFG